MRELEPRDWNNLHLAFSKSKSAPGRAPSGDPCPRPSPLHMPTFWRMLCSQSSVFALIQGDLSFRMKTRDFRSLCTYQVIKPHFLGIGKAAHKVLQGGASSERDPSRGMATSRLNLTPSPSAPSSRACALLPSPLVSMTGSSKLQQLGLADLLLLICTSGDAPVLLQSPLKFSH